ncbi:MAG: hypothetical protein QM492_12025 [Rhodobacterales bacterium]
MTALEKFERLESLGLWKETETSQKKEVIVSFGNASLVLSDNLDTPLTHWALDAVQIIDADDERVIYAPDKAGFETLEISDPTMNHAIKKLRKALHKPKLKRGRIRLLSIGLTVVLFSLLATLWLPGALADYAVGVISDTKAREIGEKLMPYITQYSGQPCRSGVTDPIIRKLENRLVGNSGDTVFIADLGARYSIHLPGRIILLNRSLVERFPEPEVLAGFVLMESTLQDKTPALRNLFLQAGSIKTLSFLITENIGAKILARFAEQQMTKPLILPDAQTLLKRFQVADISSTPFARVLNNSTLEKDDPVKGVYQPILTDPEWLKLQAICEG